MLDAWALENSKTKKRLAAALYERRHLRGRRAYMRCVHLRQTRSERLD